MLQKQNIVHAVFLLLLIAVVFIGNSLNFKAKAAFLLAVFGIVLVLNIIRFIRAVRFRKAIKNNQWTICVGTVIMAFSPTGSIDIFRTGHALAEYSVNGKSVKGWMIGVCDKKLVPDQRVKLLINKGSPKMFALSEKQVRGAVISYGVFTAISVAFVAGLTFAFFCDIFHFVQNLP